MSSKDLLFYDEYISEPVLFNLYLSKEVELVFQLSLEYF